MSKVEYPILMNDYDVWLDKPDDDDSFDIDVWTAEHQLKEMAWRNEDVLLLIKEFDGQLSIEV